MGNLPRKRGWVKGLFGHDGENRGNDSKEIVVEEESREERSKTPSLVIDGDGAMSNAEGLPAEREGDEGAVSTSAVEEAISPEEIAAREEQAEHDALVAVFDDVRARSADSELVQPVRWGQIGFVPDHMTADDFEMFVYEYLEDFLAQEAQDAADAPAEEKRIYRSATRAVGVPLVDEPEALSKERFESEAEDVAATTAESSEPDGGEQGIDGAPVVPAASDSPDFTQPVFSKSGKIMIVDGEPMFVEDEEEQVDANTPIRCAGIALLQGQRSYYLYSREFMTDNYAHWSYLAHEDNAVVTLVDCAREESRVYPRPMPAESMKNPPFNMSDEQITETWRIIEESGEFPDMATVSASNDEVYYFSTEYLSSAYAQSLAEWASVERQMNM